MTTMTLLQLNDLHGYLEPHPELVRTEGGWRFERLGGGRPHRAPLRRGARRRAMPDPG